MADFDYDGAVLFDNILDDHLFNDWTSKHPPYFLKWADEETYNQRLLNERHIAVLNNTDTSAWSDFDKNRAKLLIAKYLEQTKRADTMTRHSELRETEGRHVAVVKRTTVSLSQQLQAKRLAMGLTQDALARKAAVTKNIVQRLENPNSSAAVNPNDLRKVKRVLCL